MKRIKRSNFWTGDRYFCARCGKNVGFLNGFCSNCGDRVEWEKCPHCGCSSEMMTDGFCSDCGTTPVRK